MKIYRIIRKKEIFKNVSKIDLIKIVKTLVKSKKMCNNINIKEKDNKKEEYIYTYF